MHKIAQLRQLVVLALSAMAGCYRLSTASELEGSSSKNAATEDPPTILAAAAINADDQLHLISHHSIFVGFSGASCNERSTASLTLTDVRDIQ